MRVRVGRQRVDEARGQKEMVVVGWTPNWSELESSEKANRAAGNEDSSSEHSRTGRAGRIRQERMRWQQVKAKHGQAKGRDALSPASLTCGRVSMQQRGRSSLSTPDWSGQASSGSSASTVREWPDGQSPRGEGDASSQHQQPAGPTVKGASEGCCADQSSRPFFRTRLLSRRLRPAAGRSWQRPEPVRHRQSDIPVDRFHQRTSLPTIRGLAPLSLPHSPLLHLSPLLHAR
jgi:hypothetical protein